METLGLRERKKQLTRDTTHDVAMTLAQKRGFAEVTVEEICAGANVSARTFFNYYPSKADAIFGISLHPLTAVQREQFLHSKGGLLTDLCGVFASCIILPKDTTTLREQLSSCHTEAFAEIGAHFKELFKSMHVLAERRTSDPHQARLAVALLIAALKVVVHVDTDEEVHSVRTLELSLIAAVRELGAMAGTVDA
ncbi:MAG: TetR family transcriptional regulator [Bifidobacterium sp.]